MQTRRPHKALIATTCQRAKGGGGGGGGALCFKEEVHKWTTVESNLLIVLTCLAPSFLSPSIQPMYTPVLKCPVLLCPVKPHMLLKENILKRNSINNRNRSTNRTVGAPPPSLITGQWTLVARRAGRNPLGLAGVMGRD